MLYWVLSKGFSNIYANTALWKIGEEYAGSKDRVQVEPWNKIKFELLGVWKNTFCMAEKLCLDNSESCFCLKWKNRFLVPFMQCYLVLPQCFF